MIIIRDTASMQFALSCSLDNGLKQLLLDRLDVLRDFSDFDLSELAHFIIVEPGDHLATIEEELGFSPLVNFVDGARFGDPAFTPSFEWIMSDGHWIQMVFALSDSGFGINLIVQNCLSVDPILIAFCNVYCA